MRQQNILSVVGWILILAMMTIMLQAGAGRGQAPQETAEYRTLLTKDGHGIVRRPAPAPEPPGTMKELPVFKPGDRDPFKVDLRGKDLRGLDLAGRLPDLLMANYDDRTLWPAALPAEFNPALFMRAGKNPGLRVRELHKKGITGRGVSMAIIDMGFLVDHVEYKDRVRLFEEIHAADETAQMHGVATASIAVGRTVGVAPEADLYYVAYFPAGGGGAAANSRDFTWAAKCIDRILEINRRLPAGRKIRMISMSIGWDAKEPGYKDVMEAVWRAKQDGVFVICTTMTETYGFRIFGLSRDPRKDPDDLASYDDAWWGSYGGPGMKVLRFPMDSRTTASPTGAKEYAFYRLGGLSWVVPWAAGLYALACQVRPDITPQVFWEKALETGDSVELPPKEPSLSQEEIERRVKKNVDDGMARIKNQFPGQDLETVYAKVYSQWTGEKKDRMREADFVAWSAERVRAIILQDTKPRKLDGIVNPIALIKALQR